MADMEQSLFEVGVAEVIEEESLRSRLKDDKLTIKLGVDPTSGDLHLGHAVVLRKLAEFQQLGHKTILVIGDFTASIGDPAGVNVTRPVLTHQQIEENMKTYMEQASLIIDPKKTEIVYNSSWLAKMNLGNFLGYAQKVTLNNLIEREDFAKRLKSGQMVSLHELLYPLSQAIDSVHLKADVELGGYDQRLNLLLGRELQKKLGQKPQELVMMKLLIGTDGVKKMSSSLGNYIALTDSADEMFGKIMRIADESINDFAELGAWMGSNEVKDLSKIENPRDQKALVAKRIVQLFYGHQAAEISSNSFDETFRDKKVSEHLAQELKFNLGSIGLLQLVKDGAECSASEAMRLIRQGAVSIEGQKKSDPNEKIDLSKESMLKIGKHTFRRIGRR